MSNKENDTNNNNSDKHWRARMKWSSRRGMLEMDYFLQAFLDEYPILSKQEKQDYEKLIEFGDNEIYSWLTKQKKPVDNSLNEIIKKISQSAKKANKLN